MGPTWAYHTAILTDPIPAGTTYVGATAQASSGYVRYDEDDNLAFEFVGTVESIDPWVVSGISLTVNYQTEIQGEIEVDDLVKVEGRILPDGTWLATEIKPASMAWFGPGCLSISAMVVGVGAGQIELLGWPTIELDDSIIVEGEIAVDAIILLIICVDDDGTISIVSIIVIYQLEPVIVFPPTLPPPSGGGDVIICHKPGTSAEQTMRVPWTALSGHLGHGDTIGRPCQ